MHNNHYGVIYDGKTATGEICLQCKKKSNFFSAGFVHVTECFR